MSYLKLAASNLSKNESSTHIVNFGIRSAFPKGLGSAFAEGLGPGLGPLYKVCQLDLAYISEISNLSFNILGICFSTEFECCSLILLMLPL